MYILYKIALIEPNWILKSHQRKEDKCLQMHTYQTFMGVDTFNKSLNWQ